MPLRFLLTGNPGTEDIMATEAVEEIEGCKIISQRKGYGRIIVEVDNNDLKYLLRSVCKMRSIHHGVLLLTEGRISKNIDGLEEIKKLVAKSSIDHYMSPTMSFAVRAERAGEGHKYTSIDIAKTVGDSIINFFKRKYGKRPPVRLNSPSVIIYAEVVEEEFRSGILITGERSLHRRGYRIYDHPAALKPTLAYSMIRISGAKDGDLIVDPMCGGGTVAIEASLTFPSSRVICIDKNPLHIRGAKMNALAARVYERIEFRIGDARKLPEIVGENSVDIVISNPPYGLRLGDPYSVRKLYKEFLPALSRSLKSGGKATLITTESDYIFNLLRNEVFRLKISHIRKVRHGDLWASIMVLEKSF